MKNGNDIYANDRRQSPAFEPNYSQESRQKMSQQLEDKLQLNPNPSYKSNYQYKQDYQPNPYSQLNPNIYKPNSNHNSTANLSQNQNPPYENPNP